MLTNFSSSIISGMGISLGCIDTTIDLLNSDPDLYNTEINEIKKNSLDYESLADIKYIKPLTINRPIKPKLSRESIIKKYKLQVISNEKHDNEEIIDLEFTEDTEDFDFSFEDTAPNEAMSKDKNESSPAMYNTNGQELVLEEDSAEDEIDSIELEDEDNEGEDTDDVDNIEVEDEDDIDNIELDNDSDDDSFEDQINNIELEDEDEDTDIDDESDIDNINIDDDDTDINVEDDSNADDFSVDDIDNIDTDEYKDNTLNTERVPESTKSSSANLTNSIDTGSTKAENKEQQANAEIDELKQQIASMEKKLQDINSSKAPNIASDIYDDKLNKAVVDNIDKLTSNAKVEKTQQHNSKPVAYSQYEKYNNMSIEALYTEVSTYMKISGVSRKTVGILTLNEEFGERNIRKLLQKSYLIKFGKGVTTGRWKVG